MATDRTIKIFSTGGTIDKQYSPADAVLVVKSPAVARIFNEARVVVPYEVESLLLKDSLDITSADRAMICDRVSAETHKMIIITHGSDSLLDTARSLVALLEAENEGMLDKVIVLTGAMYPASLRESDAPFNLGFALAAVQTLPHGVHVVSNGRVFDPSRVKKNHDMCRFETED